MNSARQSIHGAPNKRREWRIALDNHYAWLQTYGWRMHEWQSIHAAPKKAVGRTEWSTGCFPPKKANMLFGKKNKSFASAPYLIETTYSCQG